ncbi:unnamed protein product [Lampetra planeri]
MIDVYRYASNNSDDEDDDDDRGLSLWVAPLGLLSLPASTAGFLTPLLSLVALVVHGGVGAQTCSPQCSICLPDVTVCHGLSRVIAVNHGTKTLLLTDGAISELRISDFSELSSLTLAAFSRNAVARIDDGAFRNLSDLRSLLLDGNSLSVSSITARTFEGLRSLRDLRLDGNALSAVRAEWFGDLAALDYLHLGGNVIASVASDAFWPSVLSNLTGLNLTGNLLAHVDRNAFRGLARLRWVDLDGNSLSAMPNAFAFSPELRSVRLGRNPWDCDDCGLLQLSAFLRAFLWPPNGTVAGEASGLRCAGPKSRTSWTILNVTAANCDTEDALGPSSPVKLMALCGEYVFLIVLLCILEALFAVVIIVATICHHKLHPLAWPQQQPQAKPPVAATSQHRGAPARTSKGEKEQRQEEEDIHVSDCASLGSTASRPEGAASGPRGGAAPHASGPPVANGRWRDGHSMGVASSKAQANFSMGDYRAPNSNLFAAALGMGPANLSGDADRRDSPTSAGHGSYPSSAVRSGGRTNRVSPESGNLPARHHPRDMFSAQLSPRGGRRIDESFSADKIEIVARGALLLPPPLPWERPRRGLGGLGPSASSSQSPPCSSSSVLNAVKLEGNGATSRDDRSTVVRTDGFLCHTHISRHITFLVPDANQLTGSSSPTGPPLNGRQPAQSPFRPSRARGGLGDGGQDAGSRKGGVGGKAACGAAAATGNVVRFIARPVQGGETPARPHVRPLPGDPKTEGGNRSRTSDEVGEPSAARRDEAQCCGGGEAAPPGGAVAEFGGTVTRGARRSQGSPPTEGEAPVVPWSATDVGVNCDDARGGEASGGSAESAPVVPSRPSCDECTGKYSMAAEGPSSCFASGPEEEPQVTEQKHAGPHPHHRPRSIEVITFAPDSTTSAAAGGGGTGHQGGPDGVRHQLSGARQPVVVVGTVGSESHPGLTTTFDGGSAPRAKAAAADNVGTMPGLAARTGEAGALRESENGESPGPGGGGGGSSSGKKLRLILPEQGSEASSEDRLNGKIK